jgi:hypothetical protein
VHHEAEGQHVAFGVTPLRLQAGCAQRRVVVHRGACMGHRGHFQPQQTRTTLRAQQHHAGLDVAMRQPGFMRKRQPVEQLHAPRRDLRGGIALPRRLFGQRDSVAAFIGDV